MSKVLAVYLNHCSLVKTFLNIQTSSARITAERDDLSRWTVCGVYVSGTLRGLVQTYALRLDREGRSGTIDSSGASSRSWRPCWI